MHPVHDLQPCRGGRGVLGGLVPGLGVGGQEGSVSSVRVVLGEQVRRCAAETQLGTCEHQLDWPQRVEGPDQNCVVAKCRGGVVGREGGRVGEGGRVSLRGSWRGRPGAAIHESQTHEIIQPSPHSLCIKNRTMRERDREFL